MSRPPFESLQNPVITTWKSCDDISTVAPDGLPVMSECSYLPRITEYHGYRQVTSQMIDYIDYIDFDVLE